MHRIRLATVIALAAAALPRALAAQGGVLVQGIVDAEAWKTDTGSTLLTRNGGDPGGVLRLDLWAAAEPWRRVVFYAQGEGVTGALDRTGTRTQVDLDQAGVRVSLAPAFVLDAGKLPQVVGTFAGRRFSTRNPLIGVPDGYPIQYPVGVMASGSTVHWDYRAALVSLPVSHPGYTPTPSASYRPAFGAGFTPVVGVRVGGSVTWGPYLNRNIPAAELAGERWQHYQERIIAADAHVSYGYLQAYAEYARSRYDVPGSADAVQGTTYYVEGAYALTPRWFVAARGERNDYPFIRPVGGSAWVARPTDFSDTEAGVGYRISAATIAKLSYRWDHWQVTPANYAFVRPGGGALALQLSQAFDLTDWLQQQ